MFFLNVSLYYQTIGALNTKNNLILVLLLYVFFKINFKKTLTEYGGYFLVVLSFVFSFNFLLESGKCAIKNLLYLNDNLNLNLLNGIMLIHPPLLYISYASIIYIFYKIYFEKKIGCVNKNIFIFLFTLLYFTVILGG